MSEVFMQIKYRGGHPNIGTPCTINITVDNYYKKLEFWQMSGMSSFQKFSIPSNDIIDISFENKKSRSIGKAATGAVVGGILTGGIGLLAGAALGARSKNKSELYLTISYSNREFVVVLVAGKKTEKLYAAIVSMFS